MIRNIVLFALVLLLCSCGGAGRDDAGNAGEKPPATEAAPDPATEDPATEDAAADTAGATARDGDTFWMLGEYTYLADAGLFTECRTGVRLPVAGEGDNAALERAYGEARSAPGAPVLVGVEAHRALRPAMDGGGEVPVLVVDRFVRVLTDTSCPPPPPDVSLENTYWKLLELDGRPVSTAGLAREPHLRLVPHERRAQGFAGCNRFRGGYTVQADSLRLGPLGATRMHCDTGGDLETAYLEALDAARAWSVAGEELVLRGDGGPVARFRAVYFR